MLAFASPFTVTHSSFTGAPQVSRHQRRPQLTRRFVPVSRPRHNNNDSTVRCIASSKVAEGHNMVLQTEQGSVSYSYFKGSGPTILFLPGFFYSRWRQAKANALEIFAKRKGQAILVGEYYGTGSTSGDFGKDGTLSRWISDTIHLIDEIVGPDGKVILVGAGVGGWIGVHAALQRPSNVVGLVGMNVSLDFTEDLIMPNMSDEQKKELDTNGVVDMQWGFRNYLIGKALVDDAKKWLCLRDGTNSLAITCPVRLIQGLADEEIPTSLSLKFVDALKSDDVELAFVKGGDHVLEGDQDFKRMWQAVCDVTSLHYEYDLTSPASG